MIPLYILGMLLRYGPQHGYQIKKLLTQQLSDFTDIKLPTIYYHLEKMQEAGFITAQNEKEGTRPEKRVYTVSALGKEQFTQLLQQTLEISYRPTFAVDSALFFSDSVDERDLVRALECHVSNLEESLSRIADHRGQVVPFLPEPMRVAADLIFQHHELHYRAELVWARQAAKAVREVE